ncbi:MAG: methylated-DNA--[protein]-cysteine S-methyltransferase [Alphaproteobacteria bacterium]|nr:MAG: methylated-DNA--[protein]-cysteine S-methyltransferase [Alphaproteobacteria bacterium]
MTANITYLDKGKQPHRVAWGCAHITAKDGIGYEGPVLFGFDGTALCFLGLTDKQADLQRHFPKSVFTPATDAHLKSAKHWLLTGQDAPAMTLYGTPFQQKVWKELLKIPCGKTVTYQYVAEKIGKPKAVRAVGSAVGKNPVSVFVPCHRVVHTSTGKVNYGWGPAVKLKLLDFEKHAA